MKTEKPEDRRKSYDAIEDAINLSKKNKKMTWDELAGTGHQKQKSDRCEDLHRARNDRRG